MDCSQFGRLSLLYFDGEADEQQINDLKKHTVLCSSCRESFETMEKMINLLETPEEISIDDSFTADVMSKINQYEEEKLRTSRMFEKYAIYASAGFITIGMLLWLFIWRNVNINLLLYRVITIAKFIVEVFISSVMSKNVIEYFEYINSQINLLMPLSLVFIGIKISIDKKRVDNDKQVS